MPSLDCYLLSPVHISDQSSLLIPPIIHSRRIYIIKDRYLFELLSKIGLFQEYNKIIREKGYNYVSKWLDSIDLLNEGVLENISQYWINDIDIRKITDYKVFQKDLNHNPTLTSHSIQDLFKKAVIYGYIKERKEEFNKLVSTELDSIEQELAYIKDVAAYNTRQAAYRKNIYKSLLESFLANITPMLAENLQNIEKLEVLVDSPLSINNLALYRVGKLNNYKNSKFQISEIAQQECLKENTLINLKISFERYSSGKYVDIQLIDYLLDKVRILVQDKLNFDKSHISRILSEDNAHINIINTLNVMNDHMQDISASDLQYELMKNKLAVLENSRKNSLNDDHIANYYSSISNSNLIICSSSEFNRLISVLNMDDKNLNRINELLCRNNCCIEAELIKVSLEKGNIPYSPIGYASIISYV